MPSLLDSALQLAAQGFRVFPLTPGGKTPALATDWKAIATTDPERIRAMWWDPNMDAPQPYNIGIAAGEGLVVLDVDNKNGKSGSATLDILEIMHGDLPPTYTVETPNGGQHYYFRSDQRIGNSVGKLGDGLDVRGEGGFVVAEGSRIGDRAYARRPGAPIERASLPEGPLRAVLAARGRFGAGTDRGVAHGLALSDCRARVEAWLETAEIAIAFAGGNDTTYRVAARVKDFGVATPLEALDVMGDWNDRCAPPWQTDELLAIIESAYKHGQNPIGSKAKAPPEAEFEAVEVVDRRTKPPEPPRPKLYFEAWDDVDPKVELDESLIDGWYDRGAMIVTYGESNVGKSNVVLSQAIAIASGQPWAGCDVRKGLVVYVAAEGGRSLKKRVRAYQRKAGVRGIPFALVPCPVDLLRPNGDTKALIALVAEAERAFGHRCEMVVIDTASRALAGGNENAPDDMGALVMHCDKIRTATGAALHLIHHSGKNKAAGARGHSLLRAATDTEIEVLENEVRSTKQRDMDTPKPMAFAYETVAIGVNGKGRPVTSIVSHITPQTDFEEKVTGEDMSRLASLVRMVRGRLGLPDGDIVTAEMSQIEITTSDLLAVWERGPGQGGLSGSERKNATRKADILVGVGQLRSEAKRGKENKYFLVTRTTRTDPDMSDLSGSCHDYPDNPDTPL